MSMNKEPNVLKAVELYCNRLNIPFESIAEKRDKKYLLEKHVIIYMLYTNDRFTIGQIEVGFNNEFVITRSLIRYAIKAIEDKISINDEMVIDKINESLGLGYYHFDHIIKSFISYIVECYPFEVDGDILSNEIKMFSNKLKNDF